MVRHFRRATLTSLLLGALLPGHAPAFQVDGFWTGMSTQQLVSVAANNGLVARPAADGYWFVGTSIPPRILGKFGFCGNYLVSYTLNIWVKLKPEDVHPSLARSLVEGSA